MLPQSATHPVIEHLQTAEQIWTKECHCCEPHSCYGTFLTILISLRCLASRIVYKDVAVFNGVSCGVPYVVISTVPRKTSAHTPSVTLGRTAN